MNEIDPATIVVYADTGTKFREVAEQILEGWAIPFFDNAGAYELGQIVTCNGRFWLGAFLWARALDMCYPRDRWLGWHACQQAERLPLVVSLLSFQPTPHSPEPGQAAFGDTAFMAAMQALPAQWEKHFGYQPLLADAHLDPDPWLPGYLAHNRWTRTTDKNPRTAGSHWIKELVPDAKASLTAKHLDRVYSGGTGTCREGLLPVPDKLLPSLRDAFMECEDPRSSNRHYSLQCLAAITVLALFSGCDSVAGIAAFSTRLSARQAEMLGLPSDKRRNWIDLPNYHTYYRLLHKVNRVMLGEATILWLQAHMGALPEVLHPDSKLVWNSLMTLAHSFKEPHRPLKFPEDTPIEYDPDLLELQREAMLYNINQSKA